MTPDRPHIPPELSTLSGEELTTLDRLADAAVDMDSDQREAFVEELRSTDPARAERLVRLLAWREPPADFLADPVLRIRGGSLAAGDTLEEQYRVESFLGSGGMGEVYAALDLVAGRRVALKTIRPTISADPTARARFRKEFQLSARVVSPNVCRTLDICWPHPPDQRRPVFLIMELLQGQTLADWMAAHGAAPPVRALSILRQAAQGLEAAHRAGVIHRDLKPGNIHLCPAPGGDLRVVLTDFGLSRQANPTASVVSSLTASGDVIGTVSYMAPELLRGEDATFASDVYAFGVVMYELIAGRKPFEIDWRSPLLSAVRALSEDAPPPSAFNPSVPPEWDAAVAGCLSRDPALRFASASAAIAVIDGQAPAAPEPPPKRSPFDWLRRKPQGRR
ncbi:MAG: serine/threonine protein kinase [Acidobacteria bacterium]|nr:serine/threonine protein kinase [Acidobacteriota bacterium]